MKLFVIHPGNVISRNDGQWHYVGTVQLMELYNVTPDECIIYGLYPRNIPSCLHHLYPMGVLDYRPVTDEERETIKNCLAFHGLRYSDYYDGDRRMAR